MKKVRNIRWHTVLIDTLKTETSNFVLNPSLHWKPVECYRRDVNPFEINIKGRLFVVDVSIYWPRNRNWQTKVLDSRKVTQRSLLRQKSVKAVVLRAFFNVRRTKESNTQAATSSGQQTTSRQNRLYVGCLTSQQHACVSQGQICSDNLTCCHAEIEVTY